MRDKVLLVDDVKMFVELQKDYLQSSAVKIFTARDGAEALQICRDERPSLVFMDLHMPVMNGAECCAAVKKDPQLRSTSIVLITTAGKESDEAICRAAGCDGFLTKPLDRLAFLDLARKLLPSVDRRDRRASCRLNARFRVFGVTLSGTVHDISTNGVYLATDHELEKGATMELVFSLPGDNGAIVQARGRVAWLNTPRHRQKPILPEGVGIEFLQVTEETSRAVERFVSSRAL